MTIIEGDITSLYHIPIIIKISTKPIIKDIEPSLNYKSANWKAYKQIIEQKIGQEEDEKKI